MADAVWCKWRYHLAVNVVAVEKIKLLHYVHPNLRTLPILRYPTYVQGGSWILLALLLALPFDINILGEKSPRKIT